MKKIFLFISLFPSLAFTQVDSIISYKDVVRVDNTTKLELFSRARKWCDSALNNFKNNNSLMDKETGELAGPGAMMFDIKSEARKHTPISVVLDYQLTLTVKDGKYKYEFSKFNVRDLSRNLVRNGLLRSNKSEDWYASKKFSETVYNETKDGVDQEVKKLISSLKRTMETGNDF